MARTQSTSLTLVFLLALTLLSCGHDAPYYVSKGDQLRQAGKYDDAAVVYRKALQRDSRSKDAYYGLAQLELRQDHWFNAYQWLRKAVIIAPDDEKILVALGDISATAYMAAERYPQNLYDELAGISGKLLKKDPRSFDGLRFQAYLAMSDGHLKEAAELFRTADQVKPMSQLVVMPWIRTLMKDHQDAEAEKLALAVINHDKTAAPAWQLLSELYSSQGRSKDVENLLRRRAEQIPSEPRYVLDLASYYFRNKRMQEMEATIQGLIARRKEFPDLDLAIGDFYTSLPDRQSAIKYYRQGLETSSSQKIAYRKRLLALTLADGNSADALELVNAILKEAPTEVATRLVRVKLEFDRQNSQAAMADLQKLRAENPSSAEVVYYLGRGHLLTGDRTSAKTEFLEAIRLQPSYIEPRLSLAAISDEQGDAQSVLTRANEILAIEPANGAAKLLRCSGLIGTGSYQVARAELRSLLQQAPDSRDVKLQFARLNLAEGSLNEAERSFAGLQSSAPDDLRVLKGLAELYFARKQPDKALQLWQKQLQKQPNSAAVREQLGDIAMRAQRYDLAIEQYRALAESGGSPEFYRKLGEAYGIKGDTDSAILNMNHVTQALPNDSDAHFMIAILQDKAGRTNQAKTEYQTALRLRPDNSRAMNNLAYLLSETGDDLNEALKLAQRAHELAPADDKIADTLGCVYLKKKMFDSAVQTFSGIVRQHSAESVYHYHLAQALVAKGDTQRARTELQKALSSQPTPVQAADIRRMLANL